MNSWYYDESQQIGTDYRNEADRIISMLQLTGNEVIADIGCGTAEITVKLAEKSALVHAVDVSAEILNYGKRKAMSKGISNIRFEPGSFLSWQHESGSLDAILTCMSFHHLPDFWKMIGLQRLKTMLRPGGILYISDVIYSFDKRNYGDVFNSWGKEIYQLSPEMGKSAMRHIKEEPSTTSWLMEKMFKQAGFTIEQTNKDNMMCSYLCRKKGIVPVLVFRKNPSVRQRF